MRLLTQSLAKAPESRPSPFGATAPDKPSVAVAPAADIATAVREQLRALLRASKLGRMQILLPMISNLPEFRQACATIDAARHELIGEGYQLAADVPVGAIIEVPAAALVSPMLARHARFFSIGTNDLIQYTLAIDRDRKSTRLNSSH